MDLRSITDEREKYAAYLCSREWGEKKEAVRKRARGTCERCKFFPMDACHHLSYARKYAEELEDLQATCKACHEFEHGKADFDPKPCYGMLCYLDSCKRSGKMAAPFELMNGSKTEFDCRDGVSESLWVIGLLRREVDKIFNLHELAMYSLTASRNITDFLGRVYHLGDDIAELHGVTFEHPDVMFGERHQYFDVKAYQHASVLLGVEIAPFSDFAKPEVNGTNGQA